MQQVIWKVDVQNNKKVITPQIQQKNTESDRASSLMDKMKGFEIQTREITQPPPPPPLSPQEDNVDIFVQVQQGLKFNAYLTIQLSEMGNLAVFGRKKNQWP